MHATDADRINSHMVAASQGYATAAMAAYLEMMTLGLDMWSAALTGFLEPGAALRPIREPEPAFGLSADDWCGLPWLDPGRVEDWTRLMSSPTPADAFAAFAGLAPLRGSYAAWPAAKSMIDAGVPRSVAWPAAEANAAALHASVAAAAPVGRAILETRPSSGSVWPLPLVMWGMMVAPMLTTLTPPPIG